MNLFFQNWEFQVYDNSRTNSYCDKGFLNIFPTLTEDRYGAGFVTTGTLDLNGGSPADEYELKFIFCFYHFFLKLILSM